MGNPSRLLVIGATSAIAHAVARRFAADGARIHLIGRRAQALAANAADLCVRGAADATTATLDAGDIDGHAAALAGAWAAFGGFDDVLIAYGTLPDQAATETSVAATVEALHVNAVSVIAWMAAIAALLEKQGTGCLAVIASPAGERGRASNYTYGAAKAAVATFVSGLRQRLLSKGVRVVTIVPGFVDTPMTAGFPKSAMWATPERVARDIQRAMSQGFGVVYTPGYWRLIMAVIRHIPERVFVKLKL